jgi:hypothetical protein
MTRRVRSATILLVWIVLLAPAAPRLGQGEGTRQEAMVEIPVDLQDGFKDDTVVISVEGRELLRDEAVSTRFQIGRAKSVKLQVPEGRSELTVEVPTRNLRGTATVDTTKPVFVGISLTTQGKLQIRVQEQPFGYL